MTVDRSTAKHFPEADGEKFYFCSTACQAKFEADPSAYRDGKRPPAKPAPKGTLYTCPMHPEVVSDRPGDCPKCGMALEPMGIPPADEGPNPELVDFIRRLSVSAILAIPLLALSMGPMFGLPLRDAIGEPRRRSSNCCWQRRWCSGRPCPSSAAHGRRSSTAARICGR